MLIVISSNYYISTDDKEKREPQVDLHIPVYELITARPIH